jgi:hypothetical protein
VLRGAAQAIGRRDLHSEILARLPKAGKMVHAPPHCGAAHVLPGGGATAAAVTYSALRRKGYNSESVGLALVAVSVLVYGALGMLFSGSLIYMLLDRDLGPVSTAASIFVLR